MKMERVAEIVRGWPYDGSLDRAELIKTGSTLVNGDWVVKQADNTVDKAGATAVSVAGLVVSGNGDSPSAANAGKAVVVWGNFIAKTTNYAAGSYAPNAAVGVKNGQLFLATVGTDPVIGYVLDVVAASATETAHITVLVK